MAQHIYQQSSSTVDLVHVRNHDRQNESSPDRNGAAILALTRHYLPISFQVDSHILVGEPAVAIADFADATENGLMILSPRWSQDTKGFAADSVTRSILCISHTPAILLPPTEAYRARSFANLLIPVAAEADLTALTQIVLFMTEAFAPSLHFVSVLHQHADYATGQLPEKYGWTYERVMRGTQSKLLELVSKLRARGVSSTWEVRHGGESEEIVRAAETTGAHLIIGSSVASASESSTAAIERGLEIARRSSVPILFYPPTRQLLDSKSVVNVSDVRSALC